MGVLKATEENPVTFSFISFRFFFTLLLKPRISENEPQNFFGILPLGIFES